MVGKYDYSDSEDDQTPGAAPVDVVDRETGDQLEDELPVDVKPAVEAPAPSSAPHPNPSIRIKIKQPKSSSTPSTAQEAGLVEPTHHRSSLSPPPPLTLRFGLPSSAPTSSRSIKAEKAAYSSSEDDDEYGPSGSRPKKSAKARKSSTPKGSKKRVQEYQPNPLVAPELHNSGNPAGRKSYDWLIPSFAGASHRGPEGRPSSSEGEHEDVDGLLHLAALGGEVKEKDKRSHKRRRDGEVPGPGKNWRKGIKKGMARAKESGIETPIASTPGNSRPGSPEGTPEEEEARAIAPRVEANPTSVLDDGPFVLADPVALGFPVFQKPIAAPKMILSNFPKVTPYFLPNNGGDTGPFPRKEKTRSWKNSDRTFVGVGGGTLKFKSWTKGPASELTQILKAEKELQEIKAKASKDGSAAKSSTTKDKDASDSKSKPQRIVTIAPHPSWPNGVPSVLEPITSHPDIEPGKPIPSVLQPYVPAEAWDPSSFPGYAPVHVVHPPPSPTASGSQAPPRKKPRPSKPRPKVARPSITKSPSSDGTASVAGDADPTEAAASSSKGPRKSKLSYELRPEEVITEW